MSVDATSTTATQSTKNESQTSQTSTAAKASLDYDAFLNLLVAEMKNQDPTDPADPAEWMGQIASFSSVEQAIQTNSKLDSMLTQMSLSQVDGLIGHTLTTMDGSASGTIKSVEIYTDGAVAILEDGTAVVLGDGVIIS